jgi:hypothetical protein
MATRKKAAKKQAKRAGGRGARPERIPPKAAQAAKKAAELLWDMGVSPHRLLQEVHELLLLRCLENANGNYAAAADLFGPSRQSVQQYANSPLRDGRWKSYQQNRRKSRDEAE